jgi:hypothetical protein
MVMTDGIFLTSLNVDPLINVIEMEWAVLIAHMFTDFSIMWSHYGYTSNIVSCSNVW